MPLVPIKLPPGIYKNGTPYTRKGRWVDSNLVRFHDGAYRPIGGWQRRRDSGGDEIDALYATPADEAVRDIFAWRDNGQTQNVVFGSNLGLYHLDSVGTVTDITYAGYTDTNSSKDASIQAGYGQSAFGIGDFGVANNLVGSDPIPPNRWYFDNFGEILLTGSRNNGGLYELDIPTLTLSAVSNAPDDIQAMVVTDQRQVLVIGGDQEPRRLQMSEVEARTTWTPAVNNQAVDRVIPGAGRLLNAVNVQRQTLILSETDAHIVRYIGPPYVVSVDLVGNNCGPIATEAVAATERFAVWWGQRNFWLYDGSVKPLDCDVIDFLQDDVDENQVFKISCFVNPEFSEIWWLYQSNATTTTEVDSYVVWDYKRNIWNTGRFDRTAGIGRGVTRSNLMVNSDGEIFNHELDTVLPSGEGDVYITSGALELGNGDKNMAVRYIFPDNQAPNQVSYSLMARQYPNGEEYTFGPYTYANPIPTTGAMGREIRMKCEFDVANSELGIVRFDVAPIGTGMR